jgi:phage baseplate assembly protein W
MRKGSKEQFYSMPFLTEYVTKTPYKKISVEESVRQHLRLILISLPGQFRYDPTFGSTLNIQHFKLPDGKRGGKKMEDELKDLVKKNLKLLIERHEPRLILEDVIVNVQTPNPTKDNKLLKNGRIALEIKLNGRIEGEEAFLHSDLVPIL